jgi:hypothetical protein
MKLLSSWPPPTARVKPPTYVLLPNRGEFANAAQTSVVLNLS